ncbi:NUDIX hydrolase [Denitrovibrio acetiphilus DSM 12809]|uniref:GDP-mannose pyrophosphatase n=1 Tax=Denitrovibrio acetiphilus (strain DSM 12809 / NBRC 114555 / N2460) TaxID=522772 RepID=D4H3Q5_DENA2|nr:NUDIX hydrolase [Denitrovibrio acetiphilus]ADD69157.1 NUDIX hydrolase [Denitrovibrio acetiphilus DSM 12809]
MEKNWKLVGAELVYKDPVLQVEHRDFHFKKNDEVGTFTVVSMKDWAVIVPVTEEGRFVLVKQYRVGTRSVAYEFPGGALEKGEKPEEGAARELVEETGYCGSLSKLCDLSPNPAFMDNTCYLYLAENCTKTSDLSLDPFEDIEPAEFSLRDVENMILNGEIVHSISIAAYGAYIALLNNVKK